MWPHVFGVLTYTMSQACGLVVVIVLSLHLAKAARLPPRRIFAALVVLVAAAIAGAALTAPSLRPTAGLRYPGVGIGILVALPLARRLLTGTASLLAFGDLIAAPLAFGTGIAKTGCFFHGCCHGPPSELPWAVAFPHRSLAWFEHFRAGLIELETARSLPVHPLPLYLAGWLMVVGMLLLYLRRRTAYDGELVLLLVALVMGGWFVVQNFQVPPTPALRTATLVVTLAAAVGLVVGRGARMLRTPRLRAVP
jgi:prolipoprotein diacylglyceryltransferase